MVSLQPQLVVVRQLCLFALPVVAGEEFESLESLISVEVLLVKPVEVLLEALCGFVLFATQQVQLRQLVQSDGFFVLDPFSSLGALQRLIMLVQALVAIGESGPHSRVLRPSQVQRSVNSVWSLTLQELLGRSSAKRRRRLD